MLQEFALDPGAVAVSADSADTPATAAATVATPSPAVSGFDGLGLSAGTLATLARLGHDTPTAVQTQTIPVLLAGHDLLVSAETGSGKTGAFLLPAMQKLAEPSTGARGAPRVLVLAPTRELALQVEVAAQRYGRHLKRLRTVSLIGGAPFGPQLRALSEGVDIVVATPGRLADHLERGRVDLSAVGLLVLDEADRMLDMGFVDEIVAICERLPATRQTVLFSATLDARIGTVAARVTRDPQRIEVAASTDAGTLTQVVHHVDHLQHKLQVLDAILGRSDVAQAIVFAGTKVAAEELAMRLRDDGRQAAALHGDMPQSARDRVVRNLRQGRVGVLVATDVAARGIDVPTITHVINFDLPMKAEDYVHRIGRTARAGRSGTSVTLVGARDRRLLAGIERLLRSRIPVEVLPGLEPRAVHAAPRRPTEHRAAPGRSVPWNRDAASGPRPPYRASSEASHRGAADARGAAPFGGPARGPAGAERRDGPPSRRPAGGVRRRHTD
jgi:superfamily II DNA/RNA helicase